jgi:hypothetical protein
LRFAITSRPSRCEEDLHLPAIDHARHTTKKRPPGSVRRPLVLGSAATAGRHCAA